MGIGDDLMASGMARGAAQRGERIAFGDGQRIIWGPHSADIFKGNPNVAPPGHERRPDVRWIKYYKGNRIYNRIEGNRWVWNFDFKAKPGEIYFDRHVLPDCDDLVVMEPNVPRQKSCAPNKQWPRERYQYVATALTSLGWRVVQPDYGAPILSGVEPHKTKTFRDALALLKRAQLYIGAEGGLHHGAAAVGTRAVVLYGGFIPPQVTGYDLHINLTGGATACGSLTPCKHCVEAMDAIKGDHVLAAAQRLLDAQV